MQQLGTIPRTCLLALVMLGVLALSAPPRAAYAQSDQSPLSVDAMSVRADAPDQTRLDLYTKIPHTNLSFLKTDEGFEANYEVTAEVHALGEEGQKQGLVQSRLWDRTVQVDAYAATQSEQVLDPTTQSLTISPGRYLVEFQLQDDASGKTFTRELTVRARELNGAVAVSDLLLLDEFNKETNTIYPSVTEQVGTERSQLQFFYELYAEQPQTVRITRTATRLKSAQGLPSVRSMLGLGSKAPEAETFFSETETRQVSAGRLQAVATIPLENAKVGDYIVRLSVEDENGQVLTQTSKPVTLHWSGLAQHIRQLDAAIAQLSYIAKDDEYEHIKNAPTRQQQLERFRAFWDKRDPTPSTQRNERMEEYYHRISLANDKYGALTEGWRTDRGHVHVLFGEPDYIERHPYNFDSQPYQIWYYYRIGRRFIFVDKNGIGRYDLLVPIWDERTRIR